MKIFSAILIICNNKIDQRKYSDLLNNQFEIDLASTISDAIIKINQNNYGLVLADLCKNIRDCKDKIKKFQASINSQIPIIYCINNKSDEKDIFTILNHQFVDHVVKPFIPELLLKKINILLELNNKNIEISKQQLELENVLYATSHDMRSPLINIEGWTKRLAYECGNLFNIIKAEDNKYEYKEVIKIINENIPEAINYIHAGVNKINSLLSGLLSLSRITKNPLILQNINMNYLLTDITSTVQYQAKKYNINIKLENLPNCIADRDQINKVFSNILDNSIKYYDQNKKSYIKIYGDTDDKFYKFFIEDNGVGIPKENIDNIFELFNQVDPGFEGEGLGLAIVRKIVERHKGYIKIESEVGVKTIITIELPKNLTNFK